MRVPQFRIEARMPKRKCRLFLVDTFTRERFCGNPAAVVLDAEQLNDDELRRLARELHGTEVAFVLAADAPDHDLEIRFFSPRREVTFIGPAALAAHYVRAIANGVPRGKVRQKSGTAITRDAASRDVRRLNGRFFDGLWPNLSSPAHCQFGSRGMPEFDRPQAIFCKLGTLATIGHVARVSHADGRKVEP